MNRFSHKVSLFTLCLVATFLFSNYAQAQNSSGCVVSSKRFGDYRGDYPSLGLTNMCKRSVRAKYCWSNGRCRCKRLPPKKNGHYTCTANFTSLQSWPTGMHGHGKLYWIEFK